MLTPPTLLMMCNNKILVRSEQGFMLIFNNPRFTDIKQQLKNFDAEEWRNNIDIVYRQELKSLDRDLLYDATSFFEAMPNSVQDQFDQNILDITGYNLDFYNQIHSTTPFRVKARLQALTVLPMLKWEFSRMDNDTQRIRCRIDAGKSIWDSFLDIHPGKTAILKRIAASSAEPTDWRGKLADLLDVLDPLPPEKVPQTEQEWNAFNSIYLGLSMENERYRNHLIVKQRWFMDCAKLGWIKTFDRLAKIEGGVDALEDTFDFLDEISHAFEAITRQQSNVPEAWDVREERRQQQWHRTVETLGLFRILESSIKWHRLLWTDAGFAAELGGTHTVWPALLPNSIQLTPEIKAVFLNTAKVLAEEGHRLGHCVGSYAHRCFLGESHIISLRNNLDQSLSTIEIRLSEYKDRTCTVYQHRALQNSTPAPQLGALESKLCNIINQSADFKALRTWRHNTADLEGIFKKSDTELKMDAFKTQRFLRLEKVLGSDRIRNLCQPVV